MFVGSQLHGNETACQGVIFIGICRMGITRTGRRLLPARWTLLSGWLPFAWVLTSAVMASPGRNQPELRLPEQPLAATALIRALGERQGTEYALFSRYAAAVAKQSETATARHSEFSGRDNLTPGSLLWAALAAEGYDNEEAFRPLQLRVRDLAQKFQADVRSSATVKTQAHALLQLLHAEILTGGYDLGCSTLSETLRSGRFNCVTATILYICLCEEVGLEAWGVEIPAHVYAEVNDRGRPLRVETTCARWFELAARDPASAEKLVPGRPATDVAIAHRQAANDVQANDAPRRLNHWQLVAIVYYNRGVDHAEQGNYPAAVASNHKALKLDPVSQTARKNLLGAINNWALSLADEGKHADALALLEHGRQLAPDHETFSTNVVALYQRWVDELCREHRFAEADAVVLAALHKHREPRLAAEQFVVYRRWGSYLVGAKQVDQALRLCALMRTRHGDDPRAANAEADLLMAAGWALLEQHKPTEALRLFDDGSRRFPQNARLMEERARAYQWYQSWQAGGGVGA